MLTEVVVTAQKRQERLVDVPASVMVLGGDALRAQKADRLEDYVARIPGLVLDSRVVGQQRLTIRGVSTGAQYASTVAVYIDDAPVGASNGDGAGGLITPEIDSIDLARIEVLRGPQGALYGASNIGGLVKYVTVAPDTTKFGVAASLDGVSLAHGGSGGAVKARINAPLITDKLALLVSGYSRKDPGFIDDAARGASDVDEADARGGRIALLATPIDGLSIKAAAIVQERSGDGFAQVDADPTTLKPLYGDYQQRRVEGLERFKNTVRLYYLSGGYDLGWAQLSATASYNTVSNKSSQDSTAGFGVALAPMLGVSNLGLGSAYDIDQDKLTGEARLSGKVGSRIEWLGGVYYTLENSDTLVNLPTFNAVTGAPIVLPAILDGAIDARFRETAGFGQFTFHASDRFDIAIGARYAKNHQASTTSLSGLLAGGSSVTLADARDSSWTYSVAPKYELTSHLNIYARLATGYRPGGANGGFAPKPTYGPDKVTNYEIGLKGAYPATGLSFEIAAFRVDWRDVQLKLLNPQNLGYTENAGKASSQGVEGNIAYSPRQGLTLTASAAYVDAQLERDIPAGTYGLKGDALPYSPRLKLSLSADYEKPIATDWTGFVGGGLYYTDKVTGEFTQSASALRVKLPSYATADARVGVNHDQWSLALVAKNMFDKRAYNGVTALTLSPTGATALSIIQPRTLSLSVRYNY